MQQHESPTQSFHVAQNARYFYLPFRCVIYFILLLLLLLVELAALEQSLAVNFNH